MTQAEIILEKFKAGRVSQGLLAKTMGIAQTTVAGWKDRGFVPAQQQAGVLAAAKALGVLLEPADFFPEQSGEAA